MEDFKNILNDIELISYLIDQVDKLLENKEKILDKFDELKKQKIKKDTVSYEEIFILNNIFKLYEEQEKMDNKKNLKEKEKEKLLKNEKIYLYVNILLIFEKKEEDNLFINNDIENRSDEDIILPGQLIKDKKDHYYPCCNCFFIGYKCFFNNDFEGINLNVSFLFYIFQYILFLLLFYSIDKTADTHISIGGIYMMIIILAWGIFIYYKLFFKKYRETFITSTC